MSLHPFAYCRPRTLGEAVEMFEAQADAAYISGGHTLLPTLKARLAAPTHLIDLTGLQELQGIEETDGGILIRGGVAHAAVAASGLVRAKIPVLAGLAGSIGDRHVRNRGTIGGSVANNDPAADYPAAVLGLGATVITTTRHIPADDYFTGLYETARDPSEIVIGVEFPVPESASYAKFRSPASRYAVAAAFVARTKGGPRVAVTGAYNGGVTRPAHFEAALALRFSNAELEPLDVAEEDMLSDPGASAAYRAALVKVMIRRAVGQPGQAQIYT